MGAYRGTMRRVLAIFWAGPAHVTPPPQPFTAKNGRKTEEAKKTTTAILHDGPGSAHIPSVARSEIEAQCMWALGMPLGTVIVL